MNCQSQQACDLQSVVGGGFEASLHFPVFLLEPLFLFQSVPLNLWVGCPQDDSPAKIVPAVVFIIRSRARADWEFVQGDGASVKIFHHLSRAGTQNLSYFSILNLVGWEWAGRSEMGHCRVKPAYMSCSRTSVNLTLVKCINRTAEQK